MMGNSKWTENCHTPSNEVLLHWQAGFGYQGEAQGGWDDVYRFIRQNISGISVDGFKADLHFAVWGFRNDYASELRRDAVSDISKKTINKHIRVCKAAITALNDLSKLHRYFGEEVDGVSNRLSEYVAKLEVMTYWKANQRRGARQKDALSRLALTFEYLWENYTRAAVTRKDGSELFQRLLTVSGCKNPPGITKAVMNTAREKKLTFVSPSPDFEFIHEPDSEPLYLRSGERALKVYSCGGQLVYLHNGESITVDNDIVQNYSPVCWDDN